VTPAVCVRRALEPPPAGQPSSDWLLSLRFGPDVLRNGMDPASFIRYLDTLGEIQAIASCCPGLAAEDDEDRFDPERNYLRVECNSVARWMPHSWKACLPLPAKMASSSSARANNWTATCNRRCPLAMPPNSRRPVKSGSNGAYGSHRQPARQHRTDDAQPAAVAATATPKTGKSSESRFIKVEAAKLDQLINLVGELVIAGAASHLLARQHGNAPLLESTSVLAGLIEQIRSQTLGMRMVPIGECFSRFGRVVHDVSHALGKDIRLFVSGADTELDKSMVDKLTDPLTHLVRNAIDHGIEDTAQRRTAGKPEAGRLWLDAYHESGSVVIEVADDGRGLNQHRILEKARQRGLLTGDRELAEQEIYRLIFEPGFSTAATISNLSGRGVGLDVVKQNIAQLRGTVEVESEAGLGTTFRLRLPLTLAIIDGFLVTVGTATFVVPLDCIAECIALPQDWQTTAAAGHFNLRGEVLPLLCLRRFLGLEGKPAPARTWSSSRLASTRWACWWTPCMANIRPSSNRSARCSST
jgi:two-component system chemotaxis sensor kinase CheA